MLPQLKAEIQSLIHASAKELGDIPSAFEVLIEEPDLKEYGDFSCNAALQLARILRRNPLELAEAIRTAFQVHLANSSVREKVVAVEVVKPGFLNFRLSPSAYYDVLESILEQKDQPRNRYINDAVQHFNRLNKRNILSKQLAIESRMVAEESMSVLSEFESLEDEDQAI